MEHKLNEQEIQRLHDTYELNYKQNSNWRIGQTYFNVLYVLFPKVAETVRGTKNDPFYDDGKVPQFLEFITSKPTSMQN